MNNWQKMLSSIVFLTVMLFLGYQHTQAPEARSDSAIDYAVLSEHVSIIAAEPHPIGSEANLKVRDYIVEYFRSLGLTTEIQKTTVVYRHPTRKDTGTTIANVENIIARLPGTLTSAEDEATDLVLMGHYDSRPLTHGAADDASGTAAIMEAARVLVQSPPPVHDIVFLITDGEEMGLLGAQGYFRQHADAKKVGLVLDFEARGSYGASSMFETSVNNNWLIENLVESTPDLSASSLSYEIYRRMPNDTDMSISKGEGIPGLNFAFVSGLFDYHAMTDTVENLDKNTLAQQANYALATATHFANLEKWQEGNADATYFNVWQGRVVSYSERVAVIIGLMVLAFGLWVFILNWRAGRLKPGAVGSGFLAMVVLIVFVSNVFESMIDYQQLQSDGVARLLSLGELPLLAYFLVALGISVWFSAVIRKGFSLYHVFVPVLILCVLSLVAGRAWPGIPVLIVILVPSLLFLRTRKNTPDIWGAALLVWWILTAVALYSIPNGSFILVWPLLSVLLGVFAQRNLPIDGRPVFSNLLFGFIPLLLLAPLIIMSYLALGTYLPQIIMIIVTLSMLLLWPLVQNLDPSASGKSGLLLLGVGSLMTLYILLGRGFDSRHPVEHSLFYAYDVDNNRSHWFSPDAAKASWLEAFFGEQAKPSNMNQILQGYDQDVVVKEGDDISIEPGRLDVKSDQLVDGQRVVSLHLQSPSVAEYINVLFQQNVKILEAKVNGFVVPVPQAVARQGEAESRADSNKSADKDDSPSWWRWRWYGLPRQGAEIDLVVEPGAPITVKLLEVDYGMRDGAPLRPDNSMPRKYTWSDSSVIYQTIRFDSD